MASIEIVNNEHTPIKKRKIDVPEEESEITVHNIFSDLSSFKLEKILSNNTTRKTVTLKGTFESESGDAIVILEKPAFSEEKLNEEDAFFSEKCYLEKVFCNDIYGDYKFFPKLELNELKATIIHPATAKHIEKYSQQNSYLVNETPEIYNSITLPHITEEQLNLKWVYNILEHKSETERIVFEDTDPETGFVLLPDLKWNGALDTLYLLAIVHKHDLKSLRSLNESHLPLLKNILEKGTETITSKYGLDASQLRIYLHYQPSFYHLHVHFTFLRHEAPGILAERAHLLSNVISNIEIASDYYQKVTLPFVVRENDNLFKKFEDKGFLKKFALPEKK